MTNTAGVIRAGALSAALACMAVADLRATAVAAVQVIVGATPIVNGDAIVGLIGQNMELFRQRATAVFRPETEKS